MNDSSLSESNISINETDTLDDTSPHENHNNNVCYHHKCPNYCLITLIVSLLLIFFFIGIFILNYTFNSTNDNSKYLSGIEPIYRPSYLNCTTYIEALNDYNVYYVNDTNNINQSIYTELGNIYHNLVSSIVPFYQDLTSISLYPASTSSVEPTIRYQRCIWLYPDDLNPSNISDHLRVSGDVIQCQFNYFIGYPTFDMVVYDLPHLFSVEIEQLSLHSLVSNYSHMEHGYPKLYTIELIINSNDDIQQTDIKNAIQNELIQPTSLFHSLFTNFTCNV